MNTDEILDKVLSAREKRASMRAQCAESGCGSLSLSLNIPGYPKSTPLFSKYFDDVLRECRQFLQAHRVPIDTTREIRQTDEAGDFYLVPVWEGPRLAAIKALAEDFEESHPLGRIVDIDVADHRLQPVSSGRLKPCLLCEKPAVVCMREANHTYEDLREHLIRRIRDDLDARKRQQICRQISALALKAVLYEISVSPKPGLVGRFEQGAHLDMDYFTFVASTSVLAGYFEELALSGYMFRGNDLREALPVIRAVGLKMEDSMFSATNGVNTQKGLIFLIGLALFSAARCLSNEKLFVPARCRETIAAICADIVRTELMTTSDSDTTHGKICFRRYGPEGGGVRKEAEDGLPSVFEHGIPELKSALAGSGGAMAAAHINRALIRTLLRLMAATSDTNILYRKDMRTLKTVQQMAQDVLDSEDGGAEAERYAQLLKFCSLENVSPGGSADLLAVTVFLYFVEQSFSAPPQHGDTD